MCIENEKSIKRANKTSSPEQLSVSFLKEKDEQNEEVEENERLREREEREREKKTRTIDQHRMQHHQLEQQIYLTARDRAFHFYIDCIIL